MRLVAVLLLLVVAACSSKATSASTVRISVSPGLSMLDQPVQIKASGLRASHPGEIRVRSTDTDGVQWSADASYIADKHGFVDPSRAAATGGSYRGVEAMGLIVAVNPSSASSVPYFWSRSRPQSFEFAVLVDGKTRATATVRRRGEDPTVSFTATTVAHDGFVGLFASRPATAHRQPAVIVLGGSEGGLSSPLAAAALASHGFPALNVAYFKAASLPANLDAIPLEYFQRAISWLARQPGVDASRITVMGASRGSEAAMLLAQHYPNLVHAAIALVPSNVSLCSSSCDGPAWTFAGKPVPFSRQLNEVTPSDTPDAVLPISDVKGPLLLACGGADQVWTSCPYAEALIKRLDAAAPGVAHRLLRFPAAGHSIAVLPPFEPSSIESGGGSAQSNRLARTELWPQIIAFLNRS